MILLYIILSTIVVSLVSLIGILFLSLAKNTLGKIIFFLISFATGSLLGGAIIHIIPEIAEQGFFPYSILTGIMIFFALEHFIFWRHCHDQECTVHPVTYLNLIGDGLHNLIDGITIAAAFLVDVKLGVVTSLIVIVHEVPQEIGDFGVLVYGGFSIKKALGCNLLSALTCVLGGIITYFVAPSELIKFFILGVSAGGFIYMALVDLLPELKKRQSFLQFVFLFLGIVLMGVMKLIFHNY